MSYEKQLQFKKARVEDCLKKIGGFKNIRVEDTLGMEEPHRYRNKVMLPVGKAEGKAEIVAIIRKKAGRGLDSEKIAEILELDPDYVKRISDLLVEDPDRSDLQVAEILVGQKEPQ